MFALALSIGLFSYSIFLLGLVGLLYKPLLIAYALTFWIGLLIWKKTAIRASLKSLTMKIWIPDQVRDFRKKLLFGLGIGYVIAQALINAIGLFGPEIGFDATWYHLTFAKLYLMYHAVVFFPGGVLIYSAMPKLAELLYTVGLAFGSDFFARGVHFLFGVLTCVVLYKLGKKFVAPGYALLLPIIFYSNLVVGWESSSGYIDLVRTFFTVVSFYAFVTWIKTKQHVYLYYTAIFVGFTVATKLLALPDILMYSVALFFYEKRKIPAFLAIIFICLLPWFAFSFVHTGNPIYPMLSQAYAVGGYWQILNPIFFISSFWTTFAYASDPINPFFLAMVPFLVIYWKKLWHEVPFLLYFALAGIAIWYITPQTGGGRYLLPYLPVFSLLCIVLLVYLSKNWQKIIICFIALVALISLGYRLLAVSKIFSLLVHKETTAQYMARHLQYNLGDFYDIDGYFKANIKPTDTILLYGFHNLYYVNFPFILSDWVKKGDKFDYVAVQGIGMPDRFRYWNLVYFNATTKVRLYRLGTKPWYY